MDRLQLARSLVGIAKGLTGAARDVVKTHRLQIDIVDWTEDEDESAYDVNLTVDGKSVTGGKGVFNVEREGGDRQAKDAAEKFAKELIRAIVNASGGKL